MNKRLSTQQKIEYFLKFPLSVLSISFGGGKYTVLYTNNYIVTHTAKSKSISRAISELYKYYNETK